MTKGKNAQGVAYCNENNVNQKQRIKCTPIALSKVPVDKQFSMA
jgi:hypothetical protein